MTRRAVPFVMVPTALIYDERISETGVRLWAILDDVARHAPCTGPLSNVELGRVIGVGERQLRRLVAELVDAGWLAVERGGGRGQHNRYAPIGRARPVGARAEERSSMSPFARGNPVTDVRVSRDGHSPLRAGEESEPGSALTSAALAAARRRPPCGRCDPSRHLERTDAAGRVVLVRCPDCHPLAVAAF